MDTLCSKLWEGLLTWTTDVHFIFKTVRGAVNITLWNAQKWHSPHLASSTNGWMNILSFCFFFKLRAANAAPYNLHIKSFVHLFANDLYIDIFTTLFYHLKHNRIVPLSIPVEFKQRHHRLLLILILSGDHGSSELLNDIYSVGETLGLAHLMWLQ
jgi:hypothetical protein